MLKIASRKVARAEAALNKSSRNVVDLCAALGIVLILHPTLSVKVLLTGALPALQMCTNFLLEEV